jgi:hypothetical protein
MDPLYAIIEEFAHEGYTPRSSWGLVIYLTSATPVPTGF